MRHSLHYAWDVLLIGGTSGIGKTTIARQLGLQLGLPWLQVDDLRLALHQHLFFLTRLCMDSKKLKVCLA